MYVIEQSEIEDLEVMEARDYLEGCDNDSILNDVTILNTINEKEYN
jgi:hypothetical protein